MVWYVSGYWLMHCHVAFHSEVGMAAILKVGNNNQMVKPPRGFPTCGNFFPSENDDSLGSGLSPHSRIIIISFILVAIISNFNYK